MYFFLRISSQFLERWIRQPKLELLYLEPGRKREQTDFCHESNRKIIMFIILAVKLTAENCSLSAIIVLSKIRSNKCNLQFHASISIVINRTVIHFGTPTHTPSNTK